MPNRNHIKLKWLLGLVIIGISTNAWSQSVTDLLKDNFYHIAERTESGTTVHAGLSYNTPLGMYATTNAIFQENGFIQDLSTGYTTSLDQLKLAFAYNATQYRYDSVYIFDGISQFRTTYRQVAYQYFIGDGFRDGEFSFSHSLHEHNFRIRINRVETDMENKDVDVTDKVSFEDSFGRLFFRWSLSENQDIETTNYHSRFHVNSWINLNAHYQSRLNRKTTELNAHFLLNRDLTASVRINQVDNIGIDERRISSLTINRNFKYVSAELLLSDAEPNLASSAFLIKYNRVLDF
ncbi:MAG: hypothetical protein OEX00_06180 [Gammaproteobacteria bacterium]|nr:hypothetical protein [Gammaproteobacteria bacterium]MDH5691667.1 hypothetical protein [Gammaproteobacteria bacterium]